MFQCGKIKVEQEYIKRILEMKGINYQEVDVSDPHQAKEKEFMRDKIKLDEVVQGAPLPPQLFKDDGYRGVCILQALCRPNAI